MANTVGQLFWKQKSLVEMNEQEWESLCDGCGKCCLHKLQDEETDELFFTNVACRHLDSQSCKCRVYPERKMHVPECLDLQADDLEELLWLPSTCAYRLLYEGKDLPVWHPLVSGDAQLLHVQQISVRDKVISEDDVDEEDWEDYMIDDLS